MAKVTTTFTSDDKEIIASIDKMNKKLAEMDEQNRKLAEQSKKNSDQAVGGFNQAITGLGKMAAGYLSINAALEAGNRLIRDQIELRQKAANVQLGTASSEREFLMNLGLVPGADQQAALNRLKELSKETGVAPGHLYGAAASAMAASGGDLATAMKALKMTAPVAAHDPATATLLAGGTIDMSKATGGDLERAFDLMGLTGQMSRAPDWSAIGNNAPGVVVAMDALGFTPDEAVAAHSTIATLMGDKQLAKSGTATTTLASRLRKFFPEHDTTDARGRVLQKGHGAMTGAERFAMVEGNEDMRRKFFQSLEESEAKPFIEQLLTPGSLANTTYRDNLKQIKGTPRGAFANLADVLNQTPLQKTADVDRRLASITERQLLDSTDAGRYSIIQNRTAEMFAATGMDLLTRKASAAEIYARSFLHDPVTAARPVVNQWEGMTRGRMERAQQSGDQAEIEKWSSANSATREMLDVLKRIESNQRAPRLADHTEGR